MGAKEDELDRLSGAEDRREDCCEVPDWSVTPPEERVAWDMYLAARLSSGSLTRSALEDADRMLEERRKRFGKAGT